MYTVIDKAQGRFIGLREPVYMHARALDMHTHRNGTKYSHNREDQTTGDYTLNNAFPIYSMYCGWNITYGVKVSICMVSSLPMLGTGEIQYNCGWNLTMMHVPAATISCLCNRFQPQQYPFGATDPSRSNMICKTTCPKHIS
jgi:hypothetical protein